MEIGALIAARLRHLSKTATMWGSPEELEAVALHFTHVWLRSRSSEWRFEDTYSLWQKHGAPLAGDADTHAAMRTRLWGEEVETARVQVVTGFITVWSRLKRDPVREHHGGAWVEALLDAPHLAGTPERLNAILFALMGFIAVDPAAYVELLQQERTRIGGHSLRGLHVVAPLGATETALTYGAPFTSWAAVRAGVDAVLGTLDRDEMVPR